MRDLAGDPAAPIVFSAALMVATVLGLAVFRRIEAGVGGRLTVWSSAVATPHPASPSDVE